MKIFRRDMDNGRPIKSSWLSSEFSDKFLRIRHPNGDEIMVVCIDSLVPGGESFRIYAWEKDGSKSANLIVVGGVLDSHNGMQGLSGHMLDIVLRRS